MLGLKLDSVYYCKIKIIGLLRIQSDCCALYIWRHQCLSMQSNLCVKMHEKTNFETHTAAPLLWNHQITDVSVPSASLLVHCWHDKYLSGRWAFFRLFQNLLLKSAMPRTNDKMGGFRSFGNVLIEASPPFPVSVINFYLSLGAPRHGQLCHNLLLASCMVKGFCFV